MPASNSEARGMSVMVWAAISWYSCGLTITLHGRIIAREYVDRSGNQMHPMIQILFLKRMQFSKTTMVELLFWFDEHAGELQHLPWATKSSHWNIIEPF
jgi:hypothetical protein